MTESTYTAAQLQALKDTLTKGEKRVSFGDKSVEYRSIEELRQAIQQVEQGLHRQAVETGLWPRAPRQVRLTSNKGT